jgi:triacylglycerol lipase
MNARIQRLTQTIGLLLGIVWLGYWFNTSKSLACIGFLAIVSAQWLLLAIEFAVMRWINQNDTTPKASLAQMAAAWLGESRVCAQVFGWRQPWRTNAQPDYLPSRMPSYTPAALATTDATTSSVSSARPANPSAHKRGVVFLHGFFCNRALWTPYMQALAAQGHAHISLTMEPAFASIDAYTGQIDRAVVQITHATGLPPILVGHSMGGLAARAWLRAANDDSRAHQIITIGTPHGGTWLAASSQARNGQQMRQSSDWLQALAAQETPARRAKFVCWMSNCDNIVFPVSNAHLEFAQNCTDHGHGHVQLAFTPTVMQDTLRRIYHT